MTDWAAQSSVICLVGQNEAIVVQALESLLRFGFRNFQFFLLQEVRNWLNEDSAKLNWALSEAAFKLGLFRDNMAPIQAQISVCPLPEMSKTCAVKDYSGWTLFVCPDNFEIENDEIACSYAPALLTLLEHPPSETFIINDTLLLDTLEKLNPHAQWPEIHTLKQAVDDFSAFALSEGPHTVQESHLEKFSFLQSLNLWKYGLIESDRAHIHTLCEMVFQDPQNDLLHLALQLYKRQTPQLLQAHCSPNTRQALNYFQESHGKHLELLMPPDDFTVTIVVVTYNRLESLKRTLDFIQMQNLPTWKLLIADGGSTDDTPNYCQSLAKSNPNIRYLYQKFPPGAKGIQQTFKMALEAIDTELIVFCPDDDVLMPNHLEQTVALFQQEPWAAMVYGSYMMVNEQGVGIRQYGPFEYEKPGLINNRLELERASIVGLCPQGCVHRRSILEKFLLPILNEPDPELYVKGWDYALAVLLFNSYEVGFVPNVVFAVTVAESSRLSGSHTDFTHDLLTVFEYLHLNYPALFGSPYPYEYRASLLNHLIQMNSMLPVFMRMFNQAESEVQLEQLIQQKMPLWKRFWRNYQTLKPVADQP